MNIRWDTDLNASNGISWSNWETDQSSGYFRDVSANFVAPGKYTVTFEVKLSNSLGQSYYRQKRYDLYVAPMPTAVYRDLNNNKLFYFVGADNVYNKPTFLVEGFDPDNANLPQVNYALGFDLIEQARSQGYDIFIMEWADGGADLASNKEVFLGACKFLHSKLGTTEAAIQVVGISMGGAVARYGLAVAEWPAAVGSAAYTEHYVNTFISFDSPQQGAHLNMGFQEFVQENGNPNQQLVLQSAAAKQMLYENVYGSVSQQFYSTLASLNNNGPAGYTNGYPRRCKNFTVSNGNHNAVYPGLTTSTPLATLRIHLYINPLNLITLPATQVEQHIYAQPRDLWAGSTFPHDLTTLHSSGSQHFGTGWFGPLFYRADAAWRFSVNFNPSYTPTESALDLAGYTRTANGSLVGGTSWFDATLEQNASYRHEELTNDSKVQVMNWLNNNRLNPYLGRPSNPTAEATVNTVTIRFVDEAAHEQGFKIDRKAEGGNWQEIATLPPNSASFSEPIANLQPFTRHYYRVRSFSGTSFSSFSSEVSIQAQPHLASNIASAVGPNNQQRLIRSILDGMYHLVYESIGEIWYAKSTDGTSWSSEYRVSDGTGQNMNPSMSVSRENDQTYVRIVWANSSGTGTVLYREWTSVPPGPGESWGTIETVPIASPSGHAPQTWTPVVGAHGWVVFNRYYGAGANGSIRVFHRDYSGVWRETTMPATTQLSKFPSIISDASSCWVVCEESGAIKYNKVQRNGDTFTWSTTTDISTGSGRTANGSPSIAWSDQNEGVFYAAWHGWHTSSNQNEIVVRKYAGSWSSEFKSFGSCTPPQSYYTPVIRGLGSDNQFGLDNMLVTWRASDNTLRSARYLGQSQSWIVSQLGVSSGQPATLAGHTDGATGRIAYVSSASSPYTIGFLEVSPAPAQVFSLGWNMAGISLLVPNYSKAAVYPTAISPAYKYVNGSYIATDPLSSNYGWWIKFGSTQPAMGYAGTRIDSMAMPVSTGWNIISSISVPVDTSTVTSTPQGIRSSQFFKYQNGYVLTDKLHPGLGYWVKSNQAGYLHLKNAAMCPSGGGSGTPPPKDKFTITDAEGNQQELFVENTEVVEGTEDIEMPPAFDEAGFDVRWGSGDIGLAVDPDNGPIELPIDVNQAAFPITLTWELDPDNEIDYLLIPPDGGGLGKAVTISARGQLRVANVVNRIQLRGKGRQHAWPLSLPVEYVLEPNYPNPFNPSTQMRYGLMQDGFVSLGIFDVLGREVRSLMRGNQSAGYHLATWDGTNASGMRLSSGLYFTRLTVTNPLGQVVYTNTNKLVMTK
ncbi:MAG: FlgD immunoglobulin-like domain containing protein [Bacteroidota bacterium]